MGCSSCGKRSVTLLKALGYVQKGDKLIKGDDVIPIAEAHKHHARVTATALGKAVLVKFKSGANTDE